MSGLEEVSRLFPDWLSASRSAEWESMKQRLTIGQTVTGIVIAKSPFGAWIDLGCEFPALLLIPEISELTPKKYQTDDWLPIGCEVSAWIIWFQDRDHEIMLSQKPRPDAAV